MSTHPPRVERYKPTDAERRAAYEAGLDNDTIDNGTTGPFDYWESDHTGLVHVLWNAKHAGLTLKEDADKIGSLILRSRWLAAHVAQAVDAAEQTRLDAEEQAKLDVTGSVN